MLRSRRALSLVYVAVLSSALGAGPPVAYAAPAALAAASPDSLPPLPADASVEQSVTVNGATLHYTATVSTLPVYGRIADDKPEIKTGEVVVTSYTLDGVSDKATRPVTFAVNGGPGAASVFLNFGAIGPKHVEYGNQGDSPSDAPKLRDNPGTWLPFSDLVFIDPVGTGFSRSLVDPAQTKKLFYGLDTDSHYLSRILYDWLTKNDRMGSRKYLVGESYGGSRGPLMTRYLQTNLGVGLSGLVLVSPWLSPWMDSTHQGDAPLAWMMVLPAMAAAKLERDHQLTPERMAEVIAYTRTQYAVDLLAGRSDPQANARLIQKVTELTGLDPTFVKEMGGRIDWRTYAHEVHREQGEVGSIYDPNVTGPSPFPYAATKQDTDDPILGTMMAPTTEAMVDWLNRTVGWKAAGRYYAVNYELEPQWDWGNFFDEGVAGDLRDAIANDPNLHVLIAHGWNDLTAKYMNSLLTVDQFPAMGDPQRVQLHGYPGGHMFYMRPESQAAFTRDVQAMFAAHPAHPGS